MQLRLKNKTDISVKNTQPNKKHEPFMLKPQPLHWGLEVGCVAGSPALLGQRELKIAAN